ncbi:hypothetical protein F4695_004502 [Rhizobium soli]|uniref:Uncharacterized protein n=1 Tax=Rhizobium soli TaxID=424798 RepID=A0A7X0JQ53_9HYPH|nr:hypothetical protein [Rhizobium soli]MBB6511104.1 hypothetical protein [Rhizobium soli]
MTRSVRKLSDNDKLVLQSLLGRYALGYHLAGPERDDLIKETFLALATRPEVFFEKSVEQAVVETMAEVFASRRLSAE